MSSRIQQPNSFAPGQWLGSHAAGVSPKERGAQKIESSTPLGESTAKEFPWMASIMTRLMPAVDSTVRFTRPGGEPSFYNNTNRPIKIDEIRICALPIPQQFTTDAPGNPLNLSIHRNVGVRIYSQRTEYIRDFLPLWNINTESNVFSEFAKSRGSLKLPTPYFLNRGNSIQVRLQTIMPVIAAISRSTIIDLALGFQGRRHADGVAIKLMRQITVPTVGATPANPLYQTVPFNENRDAPLVDCDLYHFGFGFRDLAATLAAAQDISSFPIFWVGFQFIPPQGPKWMGDNDWIPLLNLQDQIGPVFFDAGLGVAVFDNSMICFRPKSPFVLAPREELSVELRTLQAMVYAPVERVPGWVENGRGVPIWCTMYGRQESLA